MELALNLLSPTSGLGIGYGLGVSVSPALGVIRFFLFPALPLATLWLGSVCLFRWSIAALCSAPGE